METITLYRADDGQEFTSESECLEWESLRNKLVELRRELWSEEMKSYETYSNDDYLRVKRDDLWDWLGIAGPACEWSPKELKCRCSQLLDVAKRLAEKLS